ncbi:MAG: site-specific integrase [Acidobacteria bacterium]|nr:site-specific integrase [Acidobacteriota bacterium]
MRGTVIRRYKGSYSIVLDLGYAVDAATGKRKRQQKWITFRGTKKQAEQHCNDLVGKANRKEFVEPSKMTVGEWLDHWLDVACKPPRRRPRTYETYRSTVDQHLKPGLGHLRLQELQAMHIERYHAERTHLSAGTRQLHQAVLTTALKSAVKARLLYRSVAADVEGKPHPHRTADDVIANCWTAEEARAFLAATKTEPLQTRTFFALALDTGARKGELHGIRWDDIDLDTGTLRIVRQLEDPGKVRRREHAGTKTEPAFGPTKTKRARTVDLGPDTIRLLREHKRAQAELKMQNRTTYRDYGLVFAREVRETKNLMGELGMPLPTSTLGGIVFKRLIAAAGVKRITFHGLRHTCATLLLNVGEPIKVVSERLGHTNVMITMNTYAHVMPGMQKAAATRLGALLHGEAANG